MEYLELKTRDGSRTWRLRFKMEALEWFEEKTGVAIFRLEQDSLSTRDFSWLAAAGLLHEHPDSDIVDGREILNEVGFVPATQAIMERVAHDIGVNLDGKDESTNGTALKNVSGTGGRQKQTQQKSG